VVWRAYRAVAGLASLWGGVFAQKKSEHQSKNTARFLSDKTGHIQTIFIVTLLFISKYVVSRISSAPLGKRVGM